MTYSDNFGGNHWSVVCSFCRHHLRWSHVVLQVSQRASLFFKISVLGDCNFCATSQVVLDKLRYI